MSNFVVEAKDGLYKWWKNDKISGFLMPIFVLLNVLKFQNDTAYSTTELIANFSFIAVIIASVSNFYKRSAKSDEIKAKKESRIQESKDNKEIELEKVQLDREKFEHKKSVEDFSMGVISKQREYQYSLITEQADFINEQIINKTDHIVYLSKNMVIDDKVEGVIKMHEDEIELLRLYQRNLPQKIEMRFKDFLMSTREVPRILPAPELIESELGAILDNIDKNMDVTEVKEDIEVDATNTPSSS